MGGLACTHYLSLYRNEGVYHLFMCVLEFGPTTLQPYPY
jgi:hypothetical protein